MITCKMMMWRTTREICRPACVTTRTTRGIMVYRPGQVIRVKNWGKKPNGKMKQAEAELAWQSALGISAGLVFVGVPWAMSLAYDLTAQPRSTDVDGRRRIQQAVYEKRLDNRRDTP